MIKKFFSALALVLFATSMMAQSGLSCDDPIPVDKNYKGKVDGPCELWYTANTYDLPLHVYFSPDSAGSEWSPEVYVDFTCEPGVYEDSKLDSLLNKMSIFGVGLPIEFMCDGVFRNGKQEWDLSVSKSYREQLAESGITYNVKALVRVVYFESGSISLTPDTTYSSCMDNEYVQLGDTIEILPNDSNRVFVMPFTDWQKDSIQFTWVGEQEANIWLAVQECRFVPNESSYYVFDMYATSDGNPYKLQQQQIVDIIKNNKNGGIYYGKVVAPVAGKLVVEKIPMAPIQGGATLLEYGVEVNVNDENQLFCFPRTWGATEFISSANKELTMFMATGPNFNAKEDDSNIVAYHDFSSEMNIYHNYISLAEMQNLMQDIIGDYVYVRFRCATATTITPHVWDASVCADKSLMIRSLIVLSLVILGFVTHDITHIQTCVCAMAGASILLLFEKPHEILHDVEWNTIFFFIGLFIIIGGFEAAGGIELMAKWLLDVTQGSQTIATHVILWGSGILSGIIDNIPYTATMSPMLVEITSSQGMSFAYPLWWALSLGACLGGNMTIIGAAANVIVSESSAAAGHPIKFMEFLKYGVVVVIISLALSTVYLSLRFL